MSLAFVSAFFHPRDSKEKAAKPKWKSDVGCLDLLGSNFNHLLAQEISKSEDSFICGIDGCKTVLASVSIWRLCSGRFWAVREHEEFLS
jgi:hypothetical protein